MEKQTREQEIARLRDFGLIQFDKGRNQAISEFKEKILDWIDNNVSYWAEPKGDTSTTHLPSKLKKEIERTAQEVKA
jgi:hypothetical protein